MDTITQELWNMFNAATDAAGNVYSTYGLGGVVMILFGVVLVAMVLAAVTRR